MTLVAVSKTVEVERLRAAVQAGITTLGENRVQEAEAKVGDLTGVTWHLVGPLQSNKARRAIETFDVIQTVDSTGLAEQLDRLARELRGAGPGGATRCSSRSTWTTIRPRPAWRPATFPASSKP